MQASLFCTKVCLRSTFLPLGNFGLHKSVAHSKKKSEFFNTSSRSLESFRREFKPEQAKREFCTWYHPWNEDLRTFAPEIEQLCKYDKLALTQVAFQLRTPVVHGERNEVLAVKLLKMATLEQILELLHTNANPLPAEKNAGGSNAFNRPVEQWTEGEVGEWFKERFLRHAEKFSGITGKDLAGFTKEDFQKPLGDIHGAAVYNAVQELKKPKDKWSVPEADKKTFDLHRFESQFIPKIQHAFEQPRHPNHFFSVKREDVITKQREKITNLISHEIPCTTRDICTPEFLFGHHFNGVTQTRSNSRVFWELHSDLSADVRVPRQEARLIDVIVGKPGPTDSIHIQIGTRGMGKSHGGYHAAKTRDEIYFDFTGTAETIAQIGEGKFKSVREYYGAILDMLHQLLPRKTAASTSEEEFLWADKIRSQAGLITKKLVAAGLIHWILFRTKYPDIPSETFFRFSIEGEAQGVIRDIFVALHSYDATSILDTIAKELEQKVQVPVIVYDESGELNEPRNIGGQIPFLARSVSKLSLYKSADPTTMYRPLFHPFASALVELRHLCLHQVLMGTTLAISNLVSGSISPLKWEEVALVSPIPPIVPTQVSTIMNYYFSTLQLSQSVCNRWSGRARLSIQYLLQAFVQKLIDLRTKRGPDSPDFTPDELQQIFDDNEPKWYDQGVDLLRSYIVGYETKHGLKLIKADEGGHVEPFSSILTYLFHDFIMCHSRKKRLVTFDVAAALLDNGLTFLPQDIQNPVAPDSLEEPAMGDALVLHYELKRKSIEDDPIIKLCLRELKEHSFGSDLIWEDFFSRFIMLHLRPQVGKRIPVSETPLFKQLAEKDPTLHCYTFVGSYCGDENSPKKTSFLDFLESRDTGVVFNPPNFAGPDRSFFLERMPLESIQSKWRYLHSLCPATRLVNIQNKYFVAGKPLSGESLKHAWHTLAAEHFYTRKKSKNMKAKDQTAKKSDKQAKELDKQAKESDKQVSELDEQAKESDEQVPESDEEEKQRTGCRQRLEAMLETPSGKELMNWNISLLVVAGDVTEKDLPEEEGEKTGDEKNEDEKKEEGPILQAAKPPKKLRFQNRLFGCITPLTFQYPDAIQNSLISLCKLTSKAFKQSVQQLFIKKQYQEIASLGEEAFWILLKPELEQILVAFSLPFKKLQTKAELIKILMGHFGQTT